MTRKLLTEIADGRPGPRLADRRVIRDSARRRP